MINSKPNPDHEYMLRSCKLCDLYHTCAFGLNRPATLICDYGLYGARCFTGLFEDEPRMNGAIRRKYKLGDYISVLKNNQITSKLCELWKKANENEKQKLYRCITKDRDELKTMKKLMQIENIIKNKLEPNAV